jgi:vacuolar-type H+-ATPase subunit E/Vma4
LKSFIKSFKGKVAVVGVGIIMLGSAGVAFASTDAGEQLRTWYNGMFDQSVSEIEADTEDYINDQIPGLEAEYEGLKEDAGVDINITRETATGEQLEEIVTAKLEHLGEIDAEQQAILAEIGLQFYNVYLDGYFEILNQADAALNYATTDLTDFTAGEGEAAVQQLTTDINQAKEEAVQELEDAIAAAQEALTTAIDSHQVSTTDNLKSQVNWAIDDLRDNVNVLLEGLVEDQQTLITTTADQLGQDAISALDEVVNGINE